MSAPIPSDFAVSAAMATWSPVTILTETPSPRAVAMVSLASSRGGSNRGSTPSSRHGPSPSARATDRERKPRLAKSPTAASTTAPICSASGTSAMITWGAPLVTLNAVPSGAVTSASVRLLTGSNGWKCPTR